MRKPVTQLILFFFILVLQSPLFSQVNYKFENISIKDGLSQSSPNCIIQDSRGILWIGTEDGLNKYDGYVFTVYKPELNNEKTISNTRIKCLLEDNDGNIWIGTNGSGIDLYDRAKDEFKRFGFPDSNIVQSSIITALEKTGNFLWIGTMSGLFKLDVKKANFESFLNDPSVNNGLSNDVITCIIKDDKNCLWIGTESGLNYFNPEKNTFVNYYHDDQNHNSLSDNSIKKLYSDEQSFLWIATTKGLDVFNKNLNQFEHINTSDSKELGMKDYVIDDIEEDQEGNLWIATNGGGVDIYLKDRDQFINLKYNYNNPYSLSTNEILSIFKDNSGIMWVGSNGLDKYNRNKEKFILYDYVPYTTQNLMYRHIHSIYEDKNGVLWVGSKSDGIHILDRERKQSSRLTYNESDKNSISSNKIRIIREHPEGTLWVGTDDKGLNKIILDQNRKPVKNTVYENNPLNQNTLTSNTIYSLYFDDENKLWIGTDYGISKMDIATGNVIRYTPNTNDPTALNNDVAYYIFGDSKNNIWVATDKGINKYNPVNNGFDHIMFDEKDKNSLSCNEILTITEDRNGIIWVGTYAHGLNSFNPETKKVDRFSDVENLTSAVVYGILFDDDGFLWLSTNSGIMKFDPHNRSVKQFSIEDGLQSNEFNGGSYWKSNSGEMFFGGQYGFNSFYPKKVQIDTVKPQIILTELKVNNKIILPGKNSPIKVQISETKEIVFDYTQNNFSITFAALHYANPKNNRYKYKLEGFDKEWIDAGSQRFVSYTRLPYRNYVFRLMASNSDGVWNETGLSVKIKVKPPFWATLWFKFLVFIIIVFVAWSFIKNRIDAEEKQKEKLRKEIEKSAQELNSAREQLEKQQEEITLQKQEIKLREKEQQDVMWFNEGLNKFSDIMSKNRGNSQKLLQMIISELVKYVEAEQGGIFLLNDDIEGELYLDLIASYAYPSERIGCRFMIGEGYVGACFKEKKVIEVDNLEKNYSRINSGLGEEHPKHLVLIPLIMDETISGVIELSSFKKLKGYRVSFIQKMAESLTSMVSSERATEKMMKLVEQSRIQTEELAEQEEELRQSLEEMMATQEESSRREEELVKQAEEFASQEVLMQEEIEKLKKENLQLKDQAENGKK